MRKKLVMAPASASAQPWTVQPQPHHHLMHPALRSAHRSLPSCTTQSSHSGSFPCWHEMTGRENRIFCRTDATPNSTIVRNEKAGGVDVRFYRRVHRRAESLILVHLHVAIHPHNVKDKRLKISEMEARPVVCSPSDYQTSL